MKKALLMGRAFGCPLLLAGSKANIIAPVLAQEILGESVTVNQFTGNGTEFVPEIHACSLGQTGAHRVDRRGEECVPRTNNGVGLISVEGTLINKGGWIGSYSGETSYQGLMRQISEAREDDDVKAVVFEFDSFGGEVAGCDDCGAAIADLTAEKPTIAILTDHAYSAAYWLASQCRTIALPTLGGAGSIGVIMMHLNVGAMLERMGQEVTIIASGDRKADGSPYASLPDSVKEKWQTEADLIRSDFCAAVGHGRGKRFGIKSAYATEANTFLGKVAKQMGLVDFVGRPSEIFDGFVEQF